ncbi:hypothetical protein LOZ31_002159 [Ophidiomyces ophidiicola]|uniref:Uncharacterized protein n=1 Tax=Ophidiomyces ophidiicola TaxID=1387563 RepID=A0ACB8UZ60_9EURO|nr:hypothetical protein LOZ31_002159 [Ophidiomyces ophidiicola]KAI2388439.1 hypothetical protein LOY88_002635 [Ophidiomyces ophidiicola]
MSSKEGMLALRASENPKRPAPVFKPNILPCKIHHNGPIDVSTRHWDPTADKENPRTLRRPLKHYLVFYEYTPYTSRMDNSLLSPRFPLLWRFSYSLTSPGSLELATSYFRGRKLRGRRVALPEGYQGVVATPTDKKLEKKAPDDLPYGSSRSLTGADCDDQGDDDVEPPPTILEMRGTFNELMVWDHERIPVADDPFVKGIIRFPKLSDLEMHSDGSQAVTPKN